jgi:YhcH/YjgK/YiaL family protein
MAFYGTFATVRAQAPQSPGFATAFAYVEELLRPGSDAARRVREVPVGQSRRVELGGGVFVMEQAYETKPREQGFFESHRRHIDVQVVVDGEEVMELTDAARIAVQQPFDAERDLIVYADFGDASLLRAQAGDTAVFFPADVHMPSLRRRAGAAVVRKAVVKVPVGA